MELGKSRGFAREDEEDEKKSNLSKSVIYDSWIFGKVRFLEFISLILRRLMLEVKRVHVACFGEPRRGVGVLGI